MLVGRILDSVDFQRVLASPIRGRSAHFAVHHLKSVPQHARQRPRLALPPDAAGNLSTGTPPSCSQTVDECPDRRWLGCVVPKRHARRSVTRNLIRRQMRAAMERVQTRLEPGLWVLRLRSGFSVQQFPSAASDALRLQTRQELDQLLQRAGADAPAHGGGAKAPART